MGPHRGRQSGELVSKVKKKKKLRKRNRILEEAKRIKIKVTERSTCKGPEARNPRSSADKKLSKREHRKLERWAWVPPCWVSQTWVKSLEQLKV